MQIIDNNVQIRVIIYHDNITIRKKKTFNNNF